MENIFNILGYKIYQGSKQKEEKITFFCINNSDGSIRWIWNANSKTPLFLKFYNVENFKSRSFAFLVKLIFLLKIQGLFFYKKKYLFIKANETFFDIEKDWAIFTGTVGPNNKAVLYTNHNFYKIATTNNAKKLIENEYQIAKHIISENIKIKISDYKKINENILQLSDVSNSGKRESNISIEHTNALLEMSKNKNNTLKVSEWSLFQELKNGSKDIKDVRIPKNFVRKLQMILEDISNDEKVTLTFSHGDFTPWNFYVNKSDLLIYDWEMASFSKPKGFDFFHLIIQNGVLVQRYSWQRIYKEIVLQNSKVFGFNDKDLDKYLKFYLIINMLQYLKIYSTQENWHTQVLWLFNVWNEALDYYLLSKKSKRELLILDIFDVFQNKKYGALKFPKISPENLSLSSDIDLVIQKNDYKETLNYLKNHALVSKMFVQQKTNMSNLKLITIDAEILSLDFIWQLKVRALEILDSKKLIENSIINEFGVKEVSEMDTAKFILFFYTLNNAEIPQKYLYYKNLIPRKIIDKQILTNFLQENHSNTGLNRIKNTYNYIKDLFNYKNNKGFVVTFSGVDGAGKSTIISHFSELIKKQFRKPVVVLRHRPSVLPILSVWTKGKEKARQDAINCLPRQGDNNSFAPSLFRFSYYYTDYLFGQFYIYFKYILRGYVVIYDRFYFDFINDSKRSNIVLPKFITRSGYFFLLKPDFNFFLFADPETILDRKKELSYSTIKSLTSEYISLFRSLSRNSKKTAYKSIKNEDLDTTIKVLMKTIIKTI